MQLQALNDSIYYRPTAACSAIKVEVRLMSFKVDFFFDDSNFCAPTDLGNIFPV